MKRPASTCSTSKYPMTATVVRQSGATIMSMQDIDVALNLKYDFIEVFSPPRVGPWLRNDGADVGFWAHAVALPNNRLVFLVRDVLCEMPSWRTSRQQRMVQGPTDDIIKVSMCEYTPTGLATLAVDVLCGWDLTKRQVRAKLLAHVALS